MTALSSYKQAMRPGVELEITNHYITREDHSCFGTTKRRVGRVTGSSLYYEGGQWPTKFPKASEIEQVDPQTWRVYGGGAGQKPDELFLTIRLA